jgi:hypothetical protein
LAAHLDQGGEDQLLDKNQNASEWTSTLMNILVDNRIAIPNCFGE